ncbi:LuxR C-terminal-related transcriptional regulator, partial [Burkholderia pseudomallei]
SEIALILSISESTVNIHLKNIVSKLGSTNKIHAVAKAALMGML